jgi:hypothetical protein
MTVFYQARIRAEWQDWTFGAHQATARAAAAEDLIALRRQYTELREQDLLRLAASWRSDDASSAYFSFAAADGVADDPALVAVDATFVRALFHELDDQAPSALAALLDRWTEQRRHATLSGFQPTPVQPPRVSVLLPRDESLWPPESWDAFAELELDSPRFDNTLLRWDADSGLWIQHGTQAQRAASNLHDELPFPPLGQDDEPS